MTARVLVTEGEERSSLAVVRSLGRAGHEVHVGASRSPSLAGASRYAEREIVLPNPEKNPGECRAAVRSYVREHGIEVLLPTTEQGLLALLPLREELPEVVFPFPSEESFQRVCDKSEVMCMGREVGIRTPRQRLLRVGEELGGGAGLPDFPIVVKPFRSVVETAGASMSTRVAYARDIVELDRIVTSLPQEARPLLLQERIEGDGVGVFLLLWDGAVVAAFAHRRIREMPPSGGGSVFRESVPLDPDLLDRSRQLLERFRWRGVAMVEYKMDDRVGEPVLMVVNGRFWGSLQLALDAGVDFPALLVAAARGEHPEPVLDYEVGVKSRWWWGEVDHLISVARSGNGDPRSNGNGRLRGAGSALRGWLAPGRSEVLRLRDPMPFVRETTDWFRRALHR